MLSKFVKRCFSSIQSARASGNLYTWGQLKAGLGYELRDEDKWAVPRKLDAFDNNVVKASMGPYHSAALDTDGNVWTWGLGGKGELGNGNTSDQTHPKLVEFFSDSGIKVKDVQCGKNHTIALGEDGQVYTWGFNGQSWKSFLLEPTSALGYAAASNSTSPQQVDGISKVASIAAGADYNLALTEDHNVFAWGRGEKGVFGEGAIRDIHYPTLNEAFAHLQKKKHLHFSKIKSSERSNLGLTNDGHVYGWGHNQQGNLGNKTDLGVEWPGYVDHPKPIVNTNLHGHKIIDLDISSNVSVFLTDKHEAFWAGHRDAWTPKKFDLPHGVKAVHVAVCQGAVAVLGDDNKIYMHHAFVKKTSEHRETGSRVADSSLFEGGRILSIGGSYMNRFAIVKN